MLFECVGLIFVFWPIVTSFLLNPSMNSIRFTWVLLSIKLFERIKSMLKEAKQKTYRLIARE